MKWIIEIGAKMELYESIAELSRERKYIVAAQTQEEAETLALSQDRKHYGESRIVFTSIVMKDRQS